MGISIDSSGFSGVSVTPEECRDRLTEGEINIQDLIEESFEFWRGTEQENNCVLILDKTMGYENQYLTHLHVLTDLGHGSSLERRLFFAEPVFDDYILISHGSHDDVYKLPSDTKHPIIRRNVDEADIIRVGDNVRVKAIPDSWLIEQFGLEGEFMAKNI